MPRGYYPRKPRFKPTCTIEGCTNVNMARGMCGTHYTRWQKWGDPTVTYNPRVQWLKQQIVTRDRSEGCWEWPFPRDHQGYSFARYQGTQMHAHPIALILSGSPRPKPPNHCCLHSCDNPACVNPDHLRWGTHQENMAEMKAKRRGRGARGEANKSAKITEGDVHRIREDPRKYALIADDYGISDTQVYAIKNRLKWTWVSEAQALPDGGKIERKPRLEGKE